MKIKLSAFIFMNRLINLCSDEVSWVGIVENENSELCITKIFVPKQRVTSVTTAFSGEELMSVIEEENLSIDEASKLKYWGHSHVNMGVTPSGQDESQLKAIIKDCQDYFIRGIHNKKGEHNVEVSIAFLGGQMLKTSLEVDWNDDTIINPLEMDTKIREYLATRVNKTVHWNGSTRFSGEVRTMKEKSFIGSFKDDDIDIDLAEYYKRYNEGKYGHK